ncbi:MAG: DUF2127 domain-containing protein [Candidatus Binatia bacterium]
MAVKNLGRISDHRRQRHLYTAGIYELVKHVSIARSAVTIVNILVVGYLIAKLSRKQTREQH